MQAHVYHKRLESYKAWLDSVFNPDPSLYEVAQHLKKSIQPDERRRPIDEHFVFELIERNDDYIKYLDYIPHLTLILKERFFQIFPPPKEMMTKLDALFRKIHSIYAICAPGKVFFDFNYLTHKMLEVLGYDEYISLVPITVTDSRTLLQDVIWERVLKVITNDGKHEIIPYPLTYLQKEMNA